MRATMLSVLSFVMLLLQIALLVGTAFIMPRRLRPQFSRYVVYSLLAAAAWFVYAVLAMFLNSAMNIDIPGGGYLFLGVIAWLVGTVVFVFRASRESNHDHAA